LLAILPLRPFGGGYFRDGKSACTFPYMISGHGTPPLRGIETVVVVFFFFGNYQRKILPPPFPFPHKRDGNIIIFTPVHDQLVFISRQGDDDTRFHPVP